MKTAWITLTVALAASLMAVEAQAAGFARSSRSTGSVGNTNSSASSAGYNFRQSNVTSSTLRSSGQLLVKQNVPSGSTKLGPVNTANKFNTVAAKNLAGKVNLNQQGSLGGPAKLGAVNTATKFNAVAANNRAGKVSLNTTGLLRERLRETTTGTKDPRTGQDLSKNANPGFGLPGGKDLSKAFPSAEQRWNDRLKGSLGGGSDYLGEGTPFDDKPGSNPMDDFLGKHGGNIPDPLAGQGKGRSGFSPAQDAPIQDSSGGSSVTVGEIAFGGTEIICASDYVSPKDSGATKDECIAIDYDRDGGFKTDTDRKMAIDFWRKWMPKGNNGQQYEGEGGYTGGGGRSLNDLNVGSNGRMTGKVVGGRDPGEAGLGKDAGGRLPARLEAIEKYVAQGGKARGGKAGYQNGDSGLGQDIGGAAEKRISGLKKAADSQRFVIDPNAQNPEQIPWWLEKKVSPMSQASTAQANAVQQKETAK